MHIAAVCPRCESRYQLDESMRGKRMRCPNPLCKTIFEVQAEGGRPTVPTPPPAAPAEKQPATTGTVSDFVQVLPAEIAEPAAPPAPKPPPRRVDKPPTPPITPPPTQKPRVAPTAEKPAAAPPVAPTPPAPPIAEPPVRVPPAAEPAVSEPPLDDFPGDFPGDEDASGAPAFAASPPEAGPGVWEAPPVRGTGVETISEPAARLLGAAALSGPTTAPASFERPVRRSRLRPLLAIAAMAILLAGTLGVGWWVVESARAGGEAERFKRAQELYDQGDYGEARTVLQKLVADFPTSPEAKKYRFLAELSTVRAEVYEAQALAELKPALDHTLQFTGFNQNDPQIKDRHPDIWSTLRRLAEQLTAGAEKERQREALAWARQAWSEAEKFNPPANVVVAKVREDLDKEASRIEQVLDKFGRRLAVIEALQKRVAQPSASGVQQARALAVAANLNDDSEVVSLLAEMVTAHRASIKYEAASEDDSAPPIDDEALPGLLVAPMLTRAKVANPGTSTTLALARGVLYGLASDTGAVRWARRVGIDTRELPLRVAADPITPELVLVVSSDSPSVTAVVADTGAVVWRRALASPCTGQPLLLGRLLLVPTLAGHIDEIEIAGGRLLGHYNLGQRLTVGGVRQVGTSLVYFPGDEFCTYVLDTAHRTCEAVLYSGHSAGSLRGAPIILRGRGLPANNDEPAKGPAGWLLLCQAKGTRAVELRPFELPIRDADQPAGTPILHADGMTWFGPWHDAEKLAVTTDVGFLSLWGIRQEGNRDDPLLFPLLEKPYASGGSASARAQVVHADAEGYRVLSGGKLQRLDNVLRPMSGPDLMPAWPQPPELGSALHAAEQRLAGAGTSSLVLTTLAPGRPTHLCSAVDADSGKLHWQCQLGCVPLQPLAALGSRVLLRDPTGLLLLDGEKYSDQAGSPWQIVDDLAVREPLGADDHVLLLSDKNGFLQLAWSSIPGPAKLRVRNFPLAGEGTSKIHDLPAALAGTPALGEGFVLLPLANGVAVRLDLTGGVAAGPDWRAVGADEQSPGHIVALGGDDFLITDGRRGMVRVSWPSVKVHERRGKPVELSHRIVAAPVVLPGPRPRVCVADASDTLTLLDGERLDVFKRWPMPGKITAGPYLRGNGVICVVDHKRLVGVDPERAEPWQYTMVADVVGAPVLVDGVLVVADVSGRFLALDPNTGSPLSAAGYTLKANIAAEAAPVPFGAGRLLAPLNDGTLLLLPLAKLR